MGFHRHRFETLHGRKSAHGISGDESAPSNQLDTHFFKDRNREEISISKHIREALPGRHDPECLALSAVIDRYLWQFNGAHINAVLLGLSGNHPATGIRDQPSFEKRQLLACKLIDPLIAHLPRLKIWESSCILESLGELKIKDDYVGPKLLERFANQCQFAAPIDFVQAIRGISDLGFQRPREISLYSKITSQAFHQIADFTPVQLLSIISSFASHRYFDKRIVDHYCEQTIVQATPLGISYYGRIARDFSQLGYHHDRFFEYASQNVSALLEGRIGTNFNERETIGMATFARSLDSLEYYVDPLLISNLRNAVISPSSDFSDYQWGIFISEIYPVFLARSIEIDEQALTRLSKFRMSDYEKAGENITHLERTVGECLKRLQYSFEPSVDFSSFNLDFLVTLPSGTRVNVEADGDIYHLVKRLDDLTIAPEYSARNKHRDIFLDFQEIRVARILGSEWSGRDLAARCRLLEERITELDI